MPSDDRTGRRPEAFASSWPLSGRLGTVVLALTLSGSLAPHGAQAAPEPSERPVGSERQREDGRSPEAAAAREDEPAAVPPTPPDPGPASASTSEDEHDGDGAQPPPATGRGLVVAGASLLGLGAAVALGGGIGYGVLTRRAARRVDEIENGGNPEGFTSAEAEAFEQEGQRNEAMQVAMVAGGSVLAVTGTVLLTLGLRRHAACFAEPRGQARLAPHALRTASGSVPGLVLSGRF